MTDQSPWEAALGTQFSRLDPRLAPYFSRIPDGAEGVGTGMFEVVGPTSALLVPILAILGRRGALLVRRGTQRPFRIRNRQTPVALVAERAVLHPDRVERMHERPVAIRRGSETLIADRLGRTGAMLAVFAARVVDGALELRSRELHLRIGPARIRIPSRIAPSIVLTEGIGADGRQRVRLTASLAPFGTLYEYRGAFEYRIEPRPATPVAA